VWINFGVIFDITSKKGKIEELKKQSHAEDFWNDNEKAQKILKEKSQLESWVTGFEDVDKGVNDLDEFFLLYEEEQDESLVEDIFSEHKEFIQNLENLEFKNMLSDEDDHRNAIVTIHPGAGGTESQDWASMLFRMYKRWVEQHKYKFELLDYQDGEEAGIKSATFKVSGDYAFGYLKSENGVHRLVRISPFDSGGRRHTSFASIYAYPEIDDDIEIEINQTDIRVDTYRASGAGGQHVNKTDSAIRITHNPTGIVVQCQDGRSQHQNRDSAMKMLKSRLYQLEREKQKEERAKIEGEKMEIGFGSQIRSYVFHPYNMVKDHRTNTETSNTTAVMDGGIDMFIKAYLEQSN
jgi:peptide chain release factor 2